MNIINMTSIFLSLLAFVKFSAPANVEKQEWDQLNSELKSKLAPLYRDISLASPDEIPSLGNRLTAQLRDFCVSHDDFFKDEAARNPSKKYVSHQKKTIAQLEVLKKSLRKEAFGKKRFRREES